MRVWWSVWRHSAGWLVCAERSISRVVRPVFIRCPSLYRPNSTEIGREQRIRHGVRQWAIREIRPYWNQGRKCKGA